MKPMSDVFFIKDLFHGKCSQPPCGVDDVMLHTDSPYMQQMNSPNLDHCVYFDLASNISTCGGQELCQASRVCVIGLLTPVLFSSECQTESTATHNGPLDFSHLVCQTQIQVTCSFKNLSHIRTIQRDTLVHISVSRSFPTSLFTAHQT